MITLDYFLIGRQEAVQIQTTTNQRQRSKCKHILPNEWSLSRWLKYAKKPNECYILHVSLIRMQPLCKHQQAFYGLCLVFRIRKGKHWFLVPGYQDTVHALTCMMGVIEVEKCRPIFQPVSVLWLSYGCLALKPHLLKEHVERARPYQEAHGEGTP